MPIRPHPRTNNRLAKESGRGPAAVGNVCIHLVLQCRIFSYLASTQIGKHRKVRCHYVSDGDSSCRECLTRGTVCRSQDLPEPENIRESERASLNDRLGRVESLLEKVLRRLDTLDDKEEPPVSLPTETVDNSNPSSSTAITPANENAPVLSLFDNGVV